MGFIRPGVVNVSGSGLFDAYAYLRDEKTSGTQGGTPTAGATYQARTLNTEVYDSSGIVSISSNQFPLAAGTYLLVERAPFYATGRARLRFYNATDAAAVGYGVASYSTSGGDPTQCHPTVTAVVTITGTKAFELQYSAASASGGTNGLGVAESDAGVNEVYGEVEIWRKSS